MIKRLRIIYLFLAISLAFASCRSARTTRTVVVADADASSYINKYSSLAISEMKRTGIPASITLAQGMIESDFGRSSLAREGNNHFGIKCHDDWKGPTMRHDDDRKNECFRKYSRAEESFRDHSDFLTKTPRYSSLFSLSQTDYKGWAHGLRKAGYATNPDYANMLIRKIEENKLYVFDNGRQPSVARTEDRKQTENDVTGNAPVYNTKVSSTVSVPEKPQRVMENNRIQYIIVRDGETKTSIEKEFQLLKWELSKYNELPDEFVPQPGQLLYLQPKRDKAEAGKDACVAGSGDRMYSLSQKYGVRIRKLYEYNRMSEGSEPSPGDKIYLRGLKPVN
jgi:flagellum-specific peptidoglycan hydrolase FlgJ